MAPTDLERIAALEHAVFGLAGDDGLLAEMRNLTSKLDRLYMAVAAAAVSFGVGSISVVVAIVATAH